MIKWETLVYDSIMQGISYEALAAEAECKKHESLIGKTSKSRSTSHHK